MINSFQKKSVQIALAVILTLIFLSFALSFHFSITNSFLIVFGGVASLFLPGFLISLIFYPISRNITEDGDKINAFDPIEWIIFAIMLSIAVNTIVLLTLQSLKFTITHSVFALTIISVNILALIGWAVAAKIRKKYG